MTIASSQTMPIPGTPGTSPTTPSTTSKQAIQRLRNHLVQQPAPGAQADAAREKSEADERRVQFIYVTCFLKARRNAEILQKEALARMDAKSHKTQALADAMWAGSGELRSEAQKCLESLMYGGQLLFAFDGTTVLQGGAA